MRTENSGEERGSGKWRRPWVPLLSAEKAPWPQLCGLATWGRAFLTSQGRLAHSLWSPEKARTKRNCIGHLPNPWVSGPRHPSPLRCHLGSWGHSTLLNVQCPSPRRGPLVGPGPGRGGRGCGLHSTLPLLQGRCSGGGSPPAETPGGPSPAPGGPGGHAAVTVHRAHGAISPQGKRLPRNKHCWLGVQPQSLFIQIANISIKLMEKCTPHNLDCLPI